MPIDRKLLVSADGKLKIGENGQLADKDCCCGETCDCDTCTDVPVFITCALGANSQCRSTDSASCDFQASLPDNWSPPFLDYDVSVCVSLIDIVLETAEETLAKPITVTIPAGEMVSEVANIPQAAAGHEIFVFDWLSCSPFRMTVALAFLGGAIGTPEGCGGPSLTGNSVCLLLIPTGTPRSATANANFTISGCVSNQASNGENVPLSASLTLNYLESPDGTTFSLSASVQIDAADTDCSNYDPPEECTPCHCSAIDIETSRSALDGFLDGVAGNTRSWSDNFNDTGILDTFDYTVEVTVTSCGDCTPR